MNKNVHMLNGSEIIMCLLSFKRYGDWYAQLVGYNNYLFVQTTDFYARLYGIIIGTPTILESTYTDNKLKIFNWKPNDDINNNFIKGEHNFTLTSNDVNTIKDTKPEELKNIQMPYYGATNIASLDRTYFNKYKKYKKKYLELKKMIFNIPKY
jgi:hypothetical protein